MKNKSILSVWHVVCGSSKKKEKRYMHMALVVLALFTVASVHAARLTQPGAAGTGTVKKSPSRPLSPAQRRATARKTVGQPAKQTTSTVPSTEPGWKLAMELLMEPVPWDPAGSIQKKYDESVAAGQLSTEQQATVIRMYNEKLATYNRWGYQQQPSQWQQWQWQQPGQQPQASFSVAGAVQGAANVGTQTADQAKGWYDWMKEKGYNWLGGSYVSGMGNTKYIAPIALGLAAGPVGLIAGALGLAGGTAALVTGGSGLAIWAFSNIMDRANFIALSGGHGTTESWLKTLKEQLAFILDNNTAAYPYYLAKQEALLSTRELYPALSDPTGVIKKAHDALLAECNAKLQAMQPGSFEFINEQQFAKEAGIIRANNGYAQSTPDQYIANLRKNNDAFIKAQALVSEYNRALNAKSVQAIIASKMAGAQAPVVAPMQQSIPEASESTTVPLTTTGTLRD